MFGKFFLYESHLYPPIRERIIKNAFVPSLLFFQWNDFTTFSRHSSNIELRKFQIIANRSGSSTFQNEISQYKHVDFCCNDEFFETILNRVLPTSKNLREEVEMPLRGPPSQAQLLVKMKQNVDEALKEKRPLDALLEVLEYETQTGDQHESEFHLKRLSGIGSVINDASAITFLDAVSLSQNPTSEQDAVKATNLFDSLAKIGLKKGYMLNIFKAKACAGIWPDRACYLLMRALDINIYLTGAYCELGELYYAKSDMERAWCCWRVARHINPNYYQLQKVGDREQLLLENWPEFF